MRVLVILTAIMLVFLLSKQVWAETHALLASFETGYEVFGWSGRDGAVAERVEGPTTDGAYYLRFRYSARPNGWPALVMETPALRITDWSAFDYMSVDLFNPGKESVVLILRLDDSSNKRYNRSVLLPPGEWTRWSIPVSEIGVNTKSIKAAHFHFDRPGTGGEIYMDNWRLGKGDVLPLQISGATTKAQSETLVYTGPPTYKVAVADTMTKIPINAPYPGPLETVASINAAKNEAEGFQLVLMPSGMDLEGVTLQASDLLHSDGTATITADRISFHQVGYVKTTWPFYSVERAGWWPDPLLDVKSFAVKNGDVQPVWVTVKTPADAKPGIYTGEVVVRPANADPTVVPLTLRVWDFTLPREGSLPLAFTFFEDVAERIHGSAAWVQKDLKHKYYDMILEYRLAPDNIYRRTPPAVSDVLYWNERGLTAFNITQVGSQKSYTKSEISMILNKIDQALKEYQAAGVADKAYVYGFDEIGPEVYPGLKQMYGAVGERFPGLKRLVAAHIATDVFGYVDAWANTIETYYQPLAAQRRAAGEEVWLYLSISGRKPYPNWFIEYPAIDARLVWWMGYLYDIDGFLYYAINHYNTRGAVPTPIDESAGPYTKWDPASFVTPGGERFNGDGLLIYAGSNGPLASIRLANIRDGLEDYEYLHLLEQRLVASGKASDAQAAAAHVKAMFADVVNGLTSYTQDPAVLRQARVHIAEAIESLN